MMLGRLPEAEFVPIWLENAARAMPKGEQIPLPLLCALSFGRALPDGLAADREKFLTEARERLVAMKSR